MPIQPIDPVSDSRIQHKTTVLNGYTYHYLYAEPESGQYSQTAFLVRGFLVFLISITAGGNTNWCMNQTELKILAFSRWLRLLTRYISLDPWMARFVHGVEVSNPSLSRYGFQGSGAGHDGVRRHGKLNALELLFSNRIEVIGDFAGIPVLHSTISTVSRQCYSLPACRSHTKLRESMWTIRTAS